MKEKYYEFTSFIFMGVLLIVIGLLLLFGKNITYQYLVGIVTFVLWVNSFRELLKFFFRKLNKKEIHRTFLSCVFHLFVCIILAVLPNFIFGIVPLLFCFYLILIGLFQIIMCFLEVRDEEVIQFKHIIICLFCFVIVYPILTSRLSHLDSFLFYFALYSLLLGISMVWEAISMVLSIQVKNSMKRHVRITLPKFVEAIIPYSIMIEINRNLALEKKQVYSFFDNDVDVDMNILIHTSNRGFNRMGHIDLCFDGVVYSFGNYDEGSRFFFDLFGSGVLFTTNRKSDYINFCIDHSKKTIFDFGIVLNQRQKDAVRFRINEIMKEAVEWDYKSDKKEKNGSSYASKLYRKTKAKFYKFSRGKYHTYFVLGNNCCLLIDDIIGKSGMDILSINGIITPGTYYDYLNRELKVKRSNVVSKEIYHYSRRAKK